MPTATLLEDEPGHCAPGARIYAIDDGAHVLVQVDSGPQGVVAELIGGVLKAMSAGNTQIVLQPTTIVPCNPDGTTESLTPTHSFPPGTTHEQALTQAGYDV